MKKSYRGSCTCGAVQFEAAIDLAAGTTRCNCTFCRKARFWFAIVPVADFRITRGADALVDYTRVPAGKAASFLDFQFCRTCGIRAFTKGSDMPGLGAFYAVNLGCLDDATDEELADTPITYADGRHDDWAHPPAEHGYL